MTSSRFSSSVLSDSDEGWVSALANSRAAVGFLKLEAQRLAIVGGLVATCICAFFHADPIAYVSILLIAASSLLRPANPFTRVPKRKRRLGRRAG